MNQDVETTEPTSANSSGTITRDSLMETARDLLRTCKSRDQLLTSLFELCVSQFNPLVSRMDHCLRGKREFMEKQDSRLNAPVAKRFQTEYLEPTGIDMLQSRTPKLFSRAYDSMEPPLALVCAPIVNLKSGETDATITMMVSNARGQAAQILSRLDALTALVSAVADSPTGLARMDNEARAIHNLAEVKSPTQFAYSLVNSLCNRSRSEQVSFGMVRGSRIELLAVSGLTRFKNSSPGIAIQRQSMEECLDADDVILHQDNQATRIFPIHRQWSADTNGSCILSIPMKSGDTVTGIVSLRRPANSPFTQEEIVALIEIVQPYGSAVRLVDRATQPLSRRIRTAAGESVRKNSNPIRLVMWLAIAAGLFWFSTGRMMFRPICSTIVTSAEVRHFSAPFQARLQKILVEPGATVTEGQVLAQFDTREMRLELESLQAEIGETQVNLRESVQTGNASQSALHQAHLEVLTAKSAALDERIQRATITAPADGSVIMGDLTRRLGDVFQQGEDVLQVAPNSGWVLEIRVPDHVAAYVEEGQTGAFAASANAQKDIEFEIQSVDGSAEVIDEQNVFVARAKLKGDPVWMRAGMEGFAKVETQEHPVWWVLCRRGIDWVRMNLWF